MSTLTDFKQLLSQGKSMCEYDNHATLLCLNQKCQLNNPFVCVKDQCKCRAIHKKCTEKRITSFLEIFDQEKQLNQTIKQVIVGNQEKIIDYISYLNDKLVNKVLSYQWLKIDKKTSTQLTKNDNIFRSTKQIQPKSSENKLNGNVYAQLWKLSNQIQQVFNQTKINTKIKQLTTNFMKEIDFYFNNVQRYLQQQRSSVVKAQKQNSKKNYAQIFQNKKPQTKKRFKQKDNLNVFQFINFQWNSQLKSQYMQISGKKIKLNSNPASKSVFAGFASKLKVALLTPKIQRQFETIKCTIKINNLKDRIGFGICTFKYIENFNFEITINKDLASIRQLQQCYMISNIKQFPAELSHPTRNLFANDKEQINAFQEGLVFRQGDQVEICFSCKGQSLNIRNITLGMDEFMQVQFPNLFSAQYFYLFVGLGKEGQQVQIIQNYTTNQ